MLIFLSFQTSAFGHDGENELERKKIFYGIENYDVITISQPGVLYYSVTDQILESVKNLESKVTFIGRANIGLEKIINADGVETLSTRPNYLYNLSIKTIEGKYADLFYSDKVSELINDDKIIISDLTAKLYSINVGDKLVLVGMNEETTELEVGDKTMNVGGKVKYMFADPTMILTPPEKDLTFPDPEVSFVMSNADFTQTTKAAAMLGLPHVCIVGDGSKITLGATDVHNSSSDDFVTEVGTTDKNFCMVFKIENLKLFAGDYNVEITSKGISKFSHTSSNLQYFIATESDSTFGG